MGCSMRHGALSSAPSMRCQSPESKLIYIDMQTAACTCRIGVLIKQAGAQAGDLLLQGLRCPGYMACRDATHCAWLPAACARMLYIYS